MYGLINLAIQELVCSQFGQQKWQQVCEIAGTLGISFNRMQSYPDALTYQLVDSVSKALGITPDQALCAFGEFWVLYTGRQGYGHLFQIAGSSLVDFLHNLDVLHSRVGQNFTALSPPSFQCEDLDGKSVRLHYYSERVGLCPMVRGVLTGLGTYFNTAVEIEHPSCVRDGAPHCEFLLKLV